MTRKSYINLQRLLRSLFSLSEAQQFVVDEYGDAINSSINWSRSLSVAIRSMVKVLARRGLINAEHFNKLESKRPARINEIRIVRRRLIENQLGIPLHQRVTEPHPPSFNHSPVATELERAIKRREELGKIGEDIGGAQREILRLKRRLRNGGALKPGDVLRHGEEERYTLIERIGEGGFATVWRARDRVSRDNVAIKVLHGQHASDMSRRSRFFEGARVMARLNHEAIVKVLTPQSTDAGYHYFSMELVDGPNLREAVLRGQVSQSDVVELLRPICKGLAMAHCTGFVHRDVKPTNILVSAMTGAKLSDFDLVMGEDITSGTRTGAMGTLRYAPPELLERPQDATASADVYGLAMTMAFVLNGEELPLSTIRNPKPVIDSLNCGRSLKSILLRALRWDPNERYQDAGEFLEALDASLQVENEPTESRRTNRIVVALGPQSGKELTLKTGSYKIGRSTHADLRIDDASISRYHATLESNSGNWYVVDNASTNGTFVNGATVERILLRHGDRIRLAREVLLHFYSYRATLGNFPASNGKDITLRQRPEPPASSTR